MNPARNYAHGHSLRIILLLTLVLPLLVFTCSSENKSADKAQIEKAFQLGEEFRNNLYLNLRTATSDDYAKALAYYKTVIDLSPFPKALTEGKTLADDDTAVLNYTRLSYSRVAEIYLDQKKLDSCLTQINLFLDGFRTNDAFRQTMRLKKGHVWELKGELDSVIFEYQTLLKEYAAAHDTKVPVLEILEIPFVLLQMYNYQGSLDSDKVLAMVGFYKELIANPPSDPLSQLATNNLSEIFVQFNQLNQAVATLETLVDSSGQIYPQVLMGIGDLYLVRAQNYPKARETFQKFAKLYPSHELAPFARYGVGRTYLEENQYQRALDIFNQLKTRYSNDSRVVPAVQFQIGQAYYRQKNWPEAKSQLDQLINKYPDSPEGMQAALFIANHYQQVKDISKRDLQYEKALKQYQNIVEKNPNSALGFTAAQMMTEVYVQQERWADAAQMLEEIIKNTPESPGKGDVYFLLGQLYEAKLKDKLKANKTYAQFFLHYPNDPRAQAALERAKQLSEELQGELSKKVSSSEEQQDSLR
ncbi:MAG: tetratricopeptide repeat protein [candidate division Zixibacteria bacterium]|nr:tetratricopeptide repeat protein [candidate division Zixibacteria bacterium]